MVDALRGFLFVCVFEGSVVYLGFGGVLILCMFAFSLVFHFGYFCFISFSSSVSGIRQKPSPKHLFW